MPKSLAQSQLGLLPLTPRYPRGAAQPHASTQPAPFSPRMSSAGDLHSHPYCPKSWSLQVDSQTSREEDIIALKVALESSDLIYKLDLFVDLASIKI